ncbi:PPE family protein, partial [Mycobacterium sp. THU-M116]
APPSVVGLLGASESPVRLASAVSPLSPELARAPIAIPPAGTASASARDRRRAGRDYDDIELGSELLGTVMQRPPSAG